MSHEVAPLHITDPDQPNVRAIAGFIAGTSVFIVVLVVGLMQYFDFQIREEVDRKQHAVESTALRKLRADEQTKLGKYSWVSQKDGTVRVPLDRALELTLRDWNGRPAGVTAFQPAGPATGAPAAPAGH